MSSRLQRELEDALNRLDKAHMRRFPVPTPELSDFVTNDILGASKAAPVVDAAAESARTHGVGSGASRLLGGDGEPIRNAEAAAAAWLKAPAALLCPSGFQANLGVVTSLARPRDTILSDELNHASLIDGARLSGARISVFRHRDLHDLEQRLIGSRGSRRRIVVTESLFSMDGDLAPLAAIASLCKKYDASLVVDEAHAVGLLGPEGSGACAILEANPDLKEVLAARIVTGSKALGVAGAFVVGSEALRDTLVNHARSFVFTTGIALPVASALSAAIEWVKGRDKERGKILTGAAFLASELRLPVPDGAIVPVPQGPPEVALEAAETLRSQGIAVHAVRPPTVPKGTSRLRIVVHADHSERDLKTIVRTLLPLIPSAPVEPQTHAPKPWVVIGTDTDAGKTVASAFVLHALANRGPAAYWKPIQSGQPSDTETVRELMADAPITFHEPAYEFDLPASPDQSAWAEGRRINENVVDAQLAEKLQASSMPLVIETAGGLCVPWNEDFQTSDWVARQRPNLILVARSGLGTLNHTQLTLHAMHAFGQKPKVLILVGPFHEENRAGLQGKLACPILQIPHLDPLDAHALRELAQTLDSTWLD
ncbi:MAG: dethiobiotin synthase [Planctomycetota bacterium]|nr:dethiobiotin synthase [Planctomycetota bacterium]